MVEKAANDLDRHERGSDSGGQPRLAFGVAMALPQKNMIPGPTAMVMRRCAGMGLPMVVRVPMTVLVMVMMSVAVMGVPRMCVIVRHKESLTRPSENVV